MNPSHILEVVLAGPTQEKIQKNQEKKVQNKQKTHLEKKTVRHSR